MARLPRTCDGSVRAYMYTVFLSHVPITHSVDFNTMYVLWEHYDKLVSVRVGYSFPRIAQFVKYSCKHIYKYRCSFFL